MRPVITICLAIALIISSSNVIAQSPASDLDRIFSAWSNATPGVVVAVKLGDSTVYRKGFGIADLEHNIPLTPESILESGSVAKQFTAMSILLLAAEGKLALTDDVRKYVPELPAYPTVITLQMLLNHTSGLKDWGSIGGLTGWPRTTRVYTQDLALHIMSLQQTTNFKPGTEYSYSNANYSLLVTIVERVSGMSLDHFTAARIFRPLGMNHTQWRNNFREVVPGRAIAYSKTGYRYEQLMPFENVHGHGGLLTTVDDLLKWNALLDKHTIGGDRVYQERIRRGKLANGKEITYASGLQIDKLNGFTEIAHSGATAGYRAWLAYYPEKKLSVVLLSNDGSCSPAAVGRQMARVFLGDEKVISRSTSTAQVATDALKKFEGYYRSTRHFEYHQLVLRDDAILIDDNKTEAMSPDSLRAGSYQWRRLNDGRLIADNAGDTLSYRKVGAPEIDKAIAGTYHSTEAESTITLTFEGNDLWVELNPAVRMKLVPVFRDAYASDDRELFEFKRNRKGKFDQLEVSISRAERMRFIRTSR